MIAILVKVQSECAETAFSMTEILTNSNTIVNIFVNIFVMVGGILGFNYVRQLREKQKNSAFNYLTRLNVRIRNLYALLSTYKNDILNYILPKEDRRELTPEKSIIIPKVINSLAQNAKEILIFLKNEEDQMPAQKGWVKSFNDFVDFLICLEQIESTPSSVLKFNFQHNLNNIHDIIEMIESRQTYLEDEIFKDAKKLLN